jgi:hypothetical protein
MVVCDGRITGATLPQPDCGLRKTRALLTTLSDCARCYCRFAVIRSGVLLQASLKTRDKPHRHPADRPIKLANAKMAACQGEIELLGALYCLRCCWFQLPDSDCWVRTKTAHRPMLCQGSGLRRHPSRSHRPHGSLNPIARAKRAWAWLRSTQISLPAV